MRAVLRYDLGRNIRLGSSTYAGCYSEKMYFVTRVFVKALTTLILSRLMPHLMPWFRSKCLHSW